MARPYLYVLIYLLSLLPMHHARASFSIYSKQLHGQTYLRLSDIATYYGMRAWRSEKTVVMYGNGKRLDLTLERREAKINQLGLHLSFAPVLHDGRVMIAERDFTLFIDPIFRDWSLPAFRVRRIVLDAGHGGKDDGATGSRLKEKDMTLAMARRLKTMLEGKGYEVILTRTDDRFIELTDRPKLVQGRNPDLFISIHFNAVTTKSVHGIETWVLTPKDTPSTPNTKLEVGAVPGNAFDKQNQRLAYEIHRYLIGTTKAEDRGIRRMRWAVLRPVNCPAVLLELGFLTNTAEENKIATEAYQQQLATAIVNGIIMYDRVGYQNGLRPRR